MSPFAVIALHLEYFSLTTYESDPLEEMRFYSSGNQGDPLLIKMDEPCGLSDTSSHV